jgi:hypothetical protein
MTEPRTLIRVIRASFVVIDVLLGLVLVVGALNVLGGLAGGGGTMYVVGGLFLAFGLGFILSACAVQWGHPWGRTLRTSLYLVASGVLAYACAPDFWHLRGDWAPEVVLTCFAVLKLIASRRWLTSAGALR